MITKAEILCSNAGDSRSVLSKKGKAKDLSIDHKPDAPKEK
jgi:protein phosphatase 2C family protein 2/3